MTADEFTRWLQGFLELREDADEGLTARQTRIVRDHLELVFEKVTPKRSATVPDSGIRSSSSRGLNLGRKFC